MAFGAASSSSAAAHLLVLLLVRFNTRLTGPLPSDLAKLEMASQQHLFQQLPISEGSGDRGHTVKERKMRLKSPYMNYQMLTMMALSIWANTRRILKAAGQNEEIVEAVGVYALYLITKCFWLRNTSKPGQICENSKPCVPDVHVWSHDSLPCLFMLGYDFKI